MENCYKYDVALSFAGENRIYVEKVANILKQANINVFYDRLEQAELWGKDLYTHLDQVYQKEARFCVIFISKYYKRKNWTNHERQSGQARAFQETQEYILPVRFDNTEIPGIRPTVGYISLKELTPPNLASIIIKKLQDYRAVSLSTISIKPSKPITQTINFNFNEINKLPQDKPVVYKILTKGYKNNYTGAAKKGEIRATLYKHLCKGKNYVPGTKVYIERMNSIQEAQQKVNRIVIKTQPKYNQLVKSLINRSTRLKKDSCKC